MTNIADIGSATNTRYEYSPPLLMQRLRELSFGLNLDYLDFEKIVQTISSSVPDNVESWQIIKHAAETLASLTSIHPDHSILAARLEVDELHKYLDGITFTENLKQLKSTSRVSSRIGDTVPNKRQKVFKDPKKGIISEEFLQIALKYADKLNAAIVQERDFNFTYFGWRTLCQSYLIKKNADQIHETPQFLFMRVALAIHGPFDDIDAVIETYELMSRKYFIHASPTLFNAGTVNQYLSSCFLVGMKEDSIDGIFRTLHDTALISKASGGIGIYASNIRANGAYVSGSNGISSGLIPMLRVFNNTARYVDQGGNKRPGAYCIYLEPWHSDVFDFLQLRKNHGKDELRARDLFIALWIPDLFMKRVQSNGDWSLFSPDEAPGLSDVYGKEFEELYEQYESTELPMKRVKAQKLWSEILQAQVETGGPFMLYKDSCNFKSNQKNLGTIKSSNLCCEIVEYSSKDETAVCNLASVALPTFIVQVTNKGSIFDFAKLHSVVKTITRNLDRVIDVCKYPIPQAEFSNMRNRPEAIGVQGLADLFLMLQIPYESQEARVLNKQIFETIYHAAIETSIELAEEYGPYETFQGSPASQGLLQFDLWGLNEDNYDFLYKDWGELKSRIQKGRGLRNSLLIGPMPTASTSQILGYTESFEPMTSNVYARRVLSGEFIIANQYMVNHFCQLGIWNEKLKNRIVADNGSVQNVQGLPDWIKKIYKTVWEIPQRPLIDMARDRAPFIDQSQSLNLFMRSPTMGKLTSMHFHAWKQGLKTGMYYLRTQAASAAIQFTVNDENTLTGPVELNKSDMKESKALVLGKYPNTTFPKRHIDFFDPKGTSIENIEPQKSDNTISWGEDTYGIHDKTPLSCGGGKENDYCESCSG
ncbi:hypothetical protein ZYGR_0AS04730 [Zygosaccharomyces rouxii]|uniref:Ribonucleoside-diphosphate reductase n=1 Tax=Zygosaccharomyces rouxii TaxID=4956 RepID=A0A1Q3AHC7_ZYGRO|nr:hypothetical protein ZYGR_0AS04730 [Zygosaccharomyces rouxii]